MRIIINGFGRIGRTVLRQVMTLPAHAGVEVVHVNDIAPLESCAYLLQYDSTYGPLPLSVRADAGALVIGTRRIPFSHHSDLGAVALPDCDIVLECTGKLHSAAMAARGLEAGARSVLISGPSPFADETVVLGANDDTLGAARIVSNASCTTNAIGPLMRALDAAMGVERAHITTIHCYTASQPLVDTPRGDLARSRAGGENIVPTTTSAAAELTKILPELGARTSVAAVRVPSLSVSAVDATVQLSRDLEGDARQMLADMAAASPVMGATQDPCVSRDMRGRAESLVLALPQTQQIGPRQLRLFGWYDNEWGFSARMIDMARLMLARGS